MTRSIRRADLFWDDMVSQIDWYRENACPEVAEGYVTAIQTTLQTLTKTPEIGRLRFSHWPELKGIRSWRVDRPYDRHLIFYRFDSQTLLAERVLHGARDLRRRLLRLAVD